MKDGTVEDTVLLNEQNNWQYKWNNLDKNHSWFVAEINVPTKYTVSYAGSEKTIIITNTYEGEKTTVPSDSTTVTTVPSDRTQTTTKPDELIQTGQLNWPIPILLIAGLLFISIGWALVNLSSKDEETV